MRCGEQARKSRERAEADFARKQQKEKRGQPGRLLFNDRGPGQAEPSPFVTREPQVEDESVGTSKSHYSTLTCAEDFADALNAKFREDGLPFTTIME